jgi:hypothetical protein
MRPAIFLAAALALIQPAAARAQMPASCPALPPHPLAIVSDSLAWRGDLALAVLPALQDAARRAGLTPITPPQPLPQGRPWECAPVLSVSLSTGWPTSVTFFVTRSSEPVTVALTLVSPDGETATSQATQTASWYSGYLSAPLSWNLPFSGIPIGTSQQVAETDAALRAADVALSQIDAPLRRLVLR